MGSASKFSVEMNPKTTTRANIAAIVSVGGLRYVGMPLARGDEARWELARALARNRGVDRAEFRERLGVDPVDLAADALDFLAVRGFVNVTAARITPRFTDLVGSALFAGLVLDDAALACLSVLAREATPSPRGR